MIDTSFEMQLFNMSAENGLVNLPDNSIDLVVTSPPYGNLRTYGGHNQYDFPFISKQLYRVMKPGGVVVWVEGDQTIDSSETLDSFRHAIGFRDVGFVIYDTMIYAKDSFPTPTAGRYYAAFEYMFVFTKGKPNTINLIKDRKNISFGRPVHGTIRKKDGSMGACSGKKKGKMIEIYGVRTNIWTYSISFGNAYKDEFVKAHPAVFPEKLAEDHILSWSNRGDLVMDIFLGSGTTAKMAKIHGRRFIGFEVNPEYFEIAKKRIDFPVNKKLFEN